MINHKIISVITLSIYLLLGSSLQAINTSAPAPQELDSIKKVSKVIDQLEGTDSSIWEGYNFHAPLVVTFSNGHIYAFNLTPKSDNQWQKLNIDNQTVLYSPVDHWGALEPKMHPAFPIEGQTAFLFHLDMINNQVMPFLVLVHEKFHQFQFENFMETPQEFDTYKDQYNVDNIALMQIEEKILIDFLNAPENQKTEILKDFMSVNNFRFAQLDDSSMAWEYDQLRMEGLADYVSVKFFDENRMLPIFTGTNHLSMMLDSYTHAENAAELAMKWRHYGVGAALGYALDHVAAPHWKEQIQLDGKNQLEILEQALKLSDSEMSARYARIKKKYNYNELKQIANASIKKYQEQISDALEEYKSMDGVVVTLEKPADQPVSGGGNSLGTFQLEDGSMMSVDDTSKSASADQMWKLEFNRVPVIFQKKGGKREFKIEPDVEIALDGKTYKLKDLMRQNKTKTFKTISWEGNAASFNCAEHPGTLIASKGQLIIQFNQA